MPAPARFRRNPFMIPAFFIGIVTRLRGCAGEGGRMSEAEIDQRMMELDRLLNDPEVRMDPHRVWSLLAEIARKARPVLGPAG